MAREAKSGTPGTLHAALTFTRRLRRCRKDRGWTQEELGERLGVSGLRISDYERGARTPTQLELAALANALGVPVPELVPKERPPGEEPEAVQEAEPPPEISAPPPAVGPSANGHADVSGRRASLAQVPELGRRIRRFRQSRGWSQEDLGARLGVGQKQISAYERQVNLPSTEVLLRMAEVFGVTLDGLAFAGGHHSVQQPIEDRALLGVAAEVDRLSVAERELAVRMLGLVVMRAKVRQLIGERDDPEIVEEP